ncbi:HD domain-containing protein [Streptosporangium sp. NPDC001559]|uniref:HD domain-containing protein n=1 Tax=Streptosporangium sp. NPDC001559 TaxID=3366187 RepID=UPI0036EF0E32
MKYAEIVVPETPATRAALEVATAYCSPALLNHSVRAYLWAAAYAAMNDIAFDAELLYVSSMLHDIGLVREFDSHTVPFEEAGGHLAWVFCAAAGWPVERRARASEVIVRHMWNEVDVEKDPEGHLLELSTGLDISGRRSEAFPEELRAEILERHPRLGIAGEFAACFEDQAKRKPTSLAGHFVRNGFAARVASNILDR